MRTLSILLLAAASLTGCKKEKYGNTYQQIRASSESYIKHAATAAEDEPLYTQFGDHIASVTPSSCIGKLEFVRFSDHPANSSLLTLVHREPSQGEVPVMADFTGNATVSVIPQLNGDVILNANGQGAFFRQDINMELLLVRMGIDQVFELPAPYTGVNLPQWTDRRNGNVITTGLHGFNQQVNELSLFGNAIPFFFGLTDSTYIEEGYLQDPSVLTRYIRSSQYDRWTMTPPAPGESKTYTSTIGFENEGIIQFYAGADNIPYTSDDIIVLRPRFWEKIYVYVSEN